MPDGRGLRRLRFRSALRRRECNGDVPAATPQAPWAGQRLPSRARRRAAVRPGCCPGGRSAVRSAPRHRRGRADLCRAGLRRCRRGPVCGNATLEFRTALRPRCPATGCGAWPTRWPAPSEQPSSTWWCTRWPAPGGARSVRRRRPAPPLGPPRWVRLAPVPVPKHPAPAPLPRSRASSGRAQSSGGTRWMWATPMSSSPWPIPSRCPCRRPARQWKPCSAAASTFISGRSLAPNELTLGVWERGAGATEACGTGAVAASAVFHRWGEVGHTVTVRMAGGDAQVDLSEPVTLTGESTYVAAVDIVND